MPDKKELELILDKLQNEDSVCYVGDKQKDFTNLKDDVFLICSNAMQYNAPDTIYFRQARAIQDVARRKFQDIRDSMKCSETEQRYEEQDKLKSIEKKTPPTLCKPVPEPLVSDISSGATPASAAETCTAPSAVIGVEKSGTISGVLDGNSSLGESKQEKTDDFSAKCSPSRIGRKIALVDENRRATYNVSLDEQPAVESDFVLSVFEDEQKRLVPVGPDAKHLYAKSLARFAGSFGPIAWKIASKSIEKVLPAGMKFGPGWVGEYEPPPATFLTHLNQNQRLSKSEICHARTDVNEKVPEMKNAEQNLKSSSKQSGLKNQINTAAPTKASHPGKGITYDDPRGRKAVFFGVSSSAEARVSETGPQMQNLNSNSMNCGFMNQMSNGISCGASIHVKEESPSEEPTDNRQAIFLSNDRTPPSTGINSPQLGNQSAVEFTKAPTIASRPSQISNPSSKLTKSSFRGNFLRDSNYMPSEMQQQLEANSFQRGNNALGMAIEEMNNETRLNNPMSFFSINQTGVKDGIGRGNNHNQTSNDPFKFAVSSGNLNQQNSPTTSVSKLNHRGKMSNQQNCSSSGIGNLNQSMPSILPMSRENCSPATSAAARAWMSVGTSATWKSANGKHTSDNPVWNTPTSASHINGDFMIRPGNLPIQVFNEASHDRNKGLVIFPQLIPTDLLKFQSHPLWQGLSPRPQTKQRDNLPPDLNIGYQPPGSPVQPSPSVMDSQQPDLALQL
ncbi:hypothetical protein AXF42_Ash019689 [Apostasia shenzhenica]|uniref:Bromo domain-containing protein n=1 Tax=Apostasia shenzhenica TaxID=1088818 RepID=A0A2H9ZTU2_9ASPA|nr:hypothetical protein AXF42_Ash019689 [Apostasia shenzhenica]